MITAGLELVRLRLLDALAQSEKRQNDEDDDYQANNVDYIVHLSFLYAGLKADWDLFYARGQDEKGIKPVRTFRPLITAPITASWLIICVCNTPMTPMG